MFYDRLPEDLNIIDELNVYYGLAIRRNLQSAEEMKKAIRTTFLHKIFTGKNPQHRNCPSRADSWYL
ncbi:hypothetical protein WH47_03701 [Habropoda laboriosa]|uniref:Uncharacterized protein n=1 Tax=Habropoda laboriosa TaxID=597456 RepID=A0A0L7QY51_9HYME|nr:hypothetical protein WH47_03701 [Habropoda laboriosa]